MADFEKAIINASGEVFPNAHVSCCFFHLGQSVYWHVQDEGLQQEYSDPLDRTLRDSVRMLLDLAFVLENDVSQVFDLWRYQAPAQLKSVTEYFKENYELAGHNIHL
ncbi:hypothetical protein QAD02_023261 [Eretmocerus hayati]|uniref:Uncharacterized protein n=1 Tax=Eretmocerus hayati TaxID=131215 RepID=A0ACC2PVN9_9HYME|nr:hypothetical protein QAD02_023261 [Eretmocerus hayati]